jgi:hypothetical protein
MSSPEFTSVTVPARIADLAFSYLLPADFRVVPLPDEKPEFENPASFFPLQVAMANYGAVIFSVAARPAYEDGAVQDWAEFLVQQEKVEVVSMKAGVVGGLPALLVEALNPTDAGVMRMRTALIEDGKRLLNLSVLAPDAIWASVEPTLQLTLSSFRLAEPRGSTTPVTRAEANAIAEKAAAAAKPPAAATGETKTSPPAGEPARWSDLALADDASALDPEQPMNVRLRDSGAGLTVRVLEQNNVEKFAVVGAGAIVATFRVPFGWHVIDDGRRTLVFDAGGKIQINVSLRRDDGDASALLDGLQAEALSEQPQIDPLRIDFAADLPGLVLRNYRDGADVLVQAFIVKHQRDNGLAHVTRVTAAPDDMTRAVNLAELILRSLNPAVPVQ